MPPRRKERPLIDRTFCRQYDGRHIRNDDLLLSGSGRSRFGLALPRAERAKRHEDANSCKIKRPAPRQHSRGIFSEMSAAANAHFSFSHVRVQCGLAPYQTAILAAGL
jgi:hypothetical protein